MGVLPSMPEVLAAVRGRVSELCCQSLADCNCSIDRQLLLPGKMLRTHLAVRLAQAGAPIDFDTLCACCVATELAHTASLCHDDVIDGGLIRRSMPTLWRLSGKSAAILIGDLLLSAALEEMIDLQAGLHARVFLQKIRQTVVAEAWQELSAGHKEWDVARCLMVARGKTGALYSFAAMICGGADDTLRDALEEAGYCVGTAYQLTDDLLDSLGLEHRCGKTLGSDASRGVCTMVNRSRADLAEIRRQVVRLCQQAAERLSPWPGLRLALEAHLSDDIQPLLDGQGLPISVVAGLLSSGQTSPRPADVSQVLSN
jgi:geranylgeranyl pyrophosphate synthase